ncbi:MAG: hypothetical protein ACTSWR_08810 [Candidatus Helarchaeota archaeon]
MNKNDKLKREELELYFKNGLFEKVIIPCIFRNKAIVEELIVEINKRINDLNYFPTSFSIKIDSLKPHERQLVLSPVMTRIGTEIEQYKYQIVPDFIIRINLSKSDQSIMLPAEIEGRLSTHIYWQSFLYSTYIISYLHHLNMPVQHILNPPFFIVYLFDNQNIRTNVINRFGGIFINLYDIEMKIPGSDIYLSELYKKGDINLQYIFDSISKTSGNDPFLLKNRKKFILSYIYNTSEKEKKEIFLTEIIKKHVVIMTEVEDWKQELMKLLSPKDVKNIPVDAIKGLTPQQLKGLTPQQLKELLKNLPKDQLKEILKDIPLD